jgi:hypothetical protein
MQTHGGKTLDHSNSANTLSNQRTRNEGLHKKQTSTNRHHGDCNATEP